MPKIKKIILISLLTISLFSLDKLGWLSWAKGGLVYFLNDVPKQVYQKVVVPEQEVESLKKDLVSCQSQVSDLEEENKSNRRLLGAGVKPETSFLTARIVSLGIGRANAIVLGDKPAKKKASVVVENMLVGQVEETIGKAVKIRFVDSKGFRLPVQVESKTGRNQGIMEFDGAYLVVKEVSADVEIEKGGLVETVAESGDFLVIGEVSEVYPSKDKVSREIKVKWFIEPEKLITVGIIN